MCGTDGKKCDSDTEGSSIYIESKDDDIGGFDGFSGDIDIATVTRVEEIWLHGAVVHWFAETIV